MNRTIGGARKAVWRLMPKYKLRYLVWARRLRAEVRRPGRRRSSSSTSSGPRRASTDGARRQLDPPGRRKRVHGLHAAPCRARPDRPGDRRSGDMRKVRLPDGTSVEQPRDDPGTIRDVVRLRAGVLPALQRRGATRLPAGGGFPPAGRPARGRRVPERRRRGPRRWSTSISTSASRPASHAWASTPRWRKAAVGVPDLRQGLEAGRRRAVGRPLPASAPLRALQHERQLPSQAPEDRVTRTASNCTPISRPNTCGRSEAPQISRR